MRIFNTLTREKDEFKPITEGEVKIYACGPTVYNYIHIGNARPLCVFDVLRRYFEWRGYKVSFVQNFTDIDDKLIKRANEEGSTVPEIAERYIKEFWTDADGLNVKHATVNPRATENIEQIQSIISALVEKGYAYQSGGDVYYRAKKFSGYGKLSHQPLEDLEAGARIDVTEIKEDPMDFCLWKGAKPGEPYWDSPWGKGRPGWHIECSAMACRYLGKTIDIHCGGLDLIFPHHENEIAQSEALTGKKFVKYWIHNGLIKVNGQKMSKSLGNSLLLEDLLKKYSAETIKFALLQTNYRADINVTDDLFPTAEKHLVDFYRVLEEAEKSGLESSKKTEKIGEDFVNCMDDDFNTALAISNLFGYFKIVRKKLKEGDVTAIEDINAIRENYDILGLFRADAKEFLKKYDKADAEDNVSVPEEIFALAEKRKAAKAEKNYALADEIRKEIADKGFILVDTKDGFTIKKA